MQRRTAESAPARAPISPHRCSGRFARHGRRALSGAARTTSRRSTLSSDRNRRLSNGTDSGFPRCARLRDGAARGWCTAAARGDRRRSKRAAGPGAPGLHRNAARSRLRLHISAQCERDDERAGEAPEKRRPPPLSPHPGPAEPPAAEALLVRLASCRRPHRLRTPPSSELPLAGRRPRHLAVRRQPAMAGATTASTSWPRAARRCARRMPARSAMSATS